MCCVGLVVDLTQLLASTESVDAIMSMLSSLLVGTANLQIVAILPEEGHAPQQPCWRTCPAPQLTR